MKKFSFISSMTVFAATVAFTFMACQKEQTTTTATTASSESNNIASTSGTVTLGGNVTDAQAALMLAEYLKTAGPKETQYIEFSITDLQNYLNAMKSKFKSDKVYVNFGVYNALTIPDGNTAYIGRKTVFFSVNNNLKKTTNTISSFGDNGGSGDDGDKNQFNHGSIYP